MNNNVVIIGNDHINTLGVIRTFGENGIQPYLILINDGDMTYVDKSKYVNKIWLCKDVNTAILTLLTKFKKSEMKPVIIPTSDEVVFYIDKFYDILNEKFIIPSIGNIKDTISKHMDKYIQFQLAQENNIQMAQSIRCNPKNLKNVNIQMKYPFIIKPILSVLGRKEDIAICRTEEDFKKIIEESKYERYSELLVQEFIEYDYECDIAGFSFNGNTSIPGVIRKTRIWPEKRGSTTYGHVENIDNYEHIVKDLINLMNKIGYNGIFDVDIFIKGDKYYLNEINFRNGAISYAYGDSYICYYWYLSVIENQFIESPKIKESYYFLNDQADLHNVLDKSITYKQYKKCIKEAKILLAKNDEDLKPYRYMYISKLLNKLKIKYIKKIYHKYEDEQLLSLKGKDFEPKIYNNNYKIIEIDKDNFLRICENKRDVKEFAKLFKKQNCKGIYLLSNEGEIIGKGFIKQKGVKDTFVKIENNNTYLITSIHINEKFRGKRYQCDLVSHLVKYYVKNIQESEIFAIVHNYNLPSKKNLERLGFRMKKNKTIIRFLKHTINKEIV